MHTKATNPIRTPAQERRIDQAIANLESLIKAWRHRKLTGKVIWAGQRFDQGRAAS